METLHVQMMGRFSLQMGSKSMAGKGDRAHQVWAVLGYLILERGRTVPVSELLALLWQDPRPNAPNALKAVLHRARARLDELWEGAGRELLLWQDGGYRWNEAIPLSVDVERFQVLCREAEKIGSAQKRAVTQLEALELYQGGFLPQLEALPWARSIHARCRELYVGHLLLVLPVLEKGKQWAQIAALCRDASAWEPSLVEPYRAHMAALTEMGGSAAAVALYEKAREVLLTQCGTLPSEEMEAQYRRSLHGMNAQALPIGTLMKQLQEPPGAGGALVCDYGIFKALCHSMARGILRGGQACVALLTLTDENGSELPRRSLECAVGNLQEVIRDSLRQGDALTRCGLSQFLLLLPQAHPAGSQVVCDRIQRAFKRQYPHSPAQLHTAVQPLQPKK